MVVARHPIIPPSSSSFLSSDSLDFSRAPLLVYGTALTGEHIIIGGGAFLLGRTASSSLTILVLTSPYGLLVFCSNFF